MFINPKHAIEQGWITGIRNPEKQVQPNAIDFTIDELKRINNNDTDWCVLCESKTQVVMRPHDTVETFSRVGHNGSLFWDLDQHHVYDGTSETYVNLPEGVAALLYTRSTFARNGIFIVSGLYDSGYKGHIGFTVYPVGGRALVEKGVRIGQIAFVSSDSAGKYAGGWNHEQGTHYADAK